MIAKTILIIRKQLQKQQLSKTKNKYLINLEKNTIKLNTINITAYDNKSYIMNSTNTKLINQKSKF